MKTFLKAGFAQIFSCCPKKLCCPKFLGGGCSPPRPLPPGPYPYGSPSKKCRLQTLESLLGIRRVPFKLFLLIFFVHCNRRSGFLFSVGNGNNLKRGWQLHMLEPLLQPWSSQVVAAHFPSLCALLGQPMTTQFRRPNPMDKVSTLKQKKYDITLSIE